MFLKTFKPEKRKEKNLKRNLEKKKLYKSSLIPKN